MSAENQSSLVIAFSEENIEPLGQYGFELDISGHNGCELLEQLLFLIQSLETPYQLLADQEPISAEEIDDTHTRIAVWTDDQANHDFLMLMTELGVTVKRAVHDKSVPDAALTSMDA
ncbi:MAG: hypothetical protein OEU46_19095 [Alphaproteobacteria bacterium]|nr:hypothetical protein [Alphaproteobacteria bacterium]